MSSWLIDITSFIRVVSDDKPTQDQARDYIRDNKDKFAQMLDNMDVKITHC